MSALTYAVSVEIFKSFPGYNRGVVVAREVRNGASSEKLSRLLREAEDAVRGRIKPDQVAEHPRIKSWREAYRSFGAKPAEFRSSIEALVRRVLRGDRVPSINALVDIGNIVSLRHLVPAGGHAVDVLKGDIALRPATGKETFIPFGSEKAEHPLPGEIVFVEGDTVLTRRWTWRQANHTLTQPETTAVEFNVDGLPPVTREEVEQACEEISELVGECCGGEARWEVLSETHPRLELFPAQ